jgi:uncharacterized protein YegL
MKPVDYVSIVLDMSGSMYNTKNQTIVNVNEQIEQMKINAKESPEREIKFNLITFNGNVYQPVINQVITEEVNKITDTSYNPVGGTALYDAMGFAISEVQKNVLNEDDSVLIIAVSDGEENSSRKFNANSLNSLISELEKSPQWTFTYIGCSKDNIKDVAKDLGIKAANCAIWSNDSSEKVLRTGGNMRSALGGYLKTRSRVKSFAGGMSCSVSNSEKYNNFYGSSDNEILDLSEEIDDKKEEGKVIQADFEVK